MRIAFFSAVIIIIIIVVVVGGGGGGGCSFVRRILFVQLVRRICDCRLIYF